MKRTIEDREFVNNNKKMKQQIMNQNFSFTFLKFELNSRGSITIENESLVKILIK